MPCGPINDLAQVFDDPQVKHRGLEVRAPHAAAGEVRMVANPIKFSATPITHDVAPPRLGEHTDEVLSRVLGLTPDRIRELRERSIV